MINNTPVGGTSNAFLRAGWTESSSGSMAISVYLKTPEALRLGISKATLYRQAEGYFLHGIHYVTTGPASVRHFFGTLRSAAGSSDWTAPEPVQY